ncbi:uncharacterized protein LOC117767279 [Hippoglossus hippoglossus]|uniref:uncharacterized protein LOC117767279 n=1 Tax=Hippoglossus hippoglossus TaxID=8267 RepID=UPI00148CC8B5|nr:uncharacterized protein LOC117767279 [Hippoglossus hippoglossus]
MSAHLCLALLALCSLTTASDPECAELLKPLEERGQVSGKWIFHVGTSDNEESLKGLKDFNSSRIELSPIPDSDNMTLRWMDRVNGKCIHGDVTGTFLRNDSEVTFHFNIHTHEHVGKHLKTCAGCILWTDTIVWRENGETKQGRHLFLFTKSGKLDDADLDVFKKQAACLNLRAEFHFGETTDLCPEEEEAATDVKEEEH